MTVQLKGALILPLLIKTIEKFQCTLVSNMLKVRILKSHSALIISSCVFSEVPHPRQPYAFNELHCHRVVATKKYQKLKISDPGANVLSPREAGQSLTETQDFNVKLTLR